MENREEVRRLLEEHRSALLFAGRKAFDRGDYRSVAESLTSRARAAIWLLSGAIALLLLPLSGSILTGNAEVAFRMLGDLAFWLVGLTGSLVVAIRKVNLARRALALLGEEVVPAGESPVERASRLLRPDLNRAFYGERAALERGDPLPAARGIHRRSERVFFVCNLLVCGMVALAVFALFAADPLLAGLPVSIGLLGAAAAIFDCWSRPRLASARRAYRVLEELESEDRSAEAATA